MDINLTGKTALVCGSSQGIGKATALSLSKMGACIALLARNEEKLQAVKNELDISQGQEHHVLQADFNSPKEIKTKVESVLEKIGPIHILVNNTGGPAGGPAIDAATEDYVKAFNMHLIANQTLAQLVVGGMMQEKYGRIINVISTSVKQPLQGLGVSNTIRGAVANWSKTIATELAPFGITVNNVLPGATNTQRLQSIIENKATKMETSTNAISSRMQKEIPMQRFANPEEIANGITFLASPAASYITGINLPIDGGRTKSL